MTADQASAEQPPGVGPPAGGGATEEAEEVGVVLAALADPTRRQLLDVLVEAGQASATTLAGRLPVSRQAVVKHLQVLKTAGLVERVRAGREVLYAARRDPLDASARWLADLSATWDRRLNALKRAAEAATSD
ncbi:MAG: winged helix-turn-helix transcriptional regulator [Actinobacteria bacterium]|nr:winged helix-turn-helix transcriptional regulator [Actinomycetota bacterium]